MACQKGWVHMSGSARSTCKVLSNLQKCLLSDSPPRTISLRTDKCSSLEMHLVKAKPGLCIALTKEHAHSAVSSLYPVSHSNKLLGFLWGMSCRKTGLCSFLELNSQNMFSECCFLFFHLLCWFYFFFRAFCALLPFRLPFLICF